LQEGLSRIKRAKPQDKPYEMRKAKGPSALEYPYDEKIEEGYISNYGGQGIHNEMIADEPRRIAYSHAFMQLMPKKIWLEVGTGTGILARCALMAGDAKFIHAVEASDIIKQAKVILDDKEFMDRYKLYKDRIEEVELHYSYPKVDYIFSEFMGYFLLHENMLQSVLIAKDRFLKKKEKDNDFEPLVIPNSCTIYLAAYSDLAHTEEMLRKFFVGDKGRENDTCTATLSKDFLLS
jgi:hypothetical protein